MKKSRAMRAALVGAFAILMLPAGRASADQTSDLKSEIEAQRALIEAQRARLDALEKKLDAAVTAQQATETKQAAQAAEAKQAADAREAAAKEAAENGFKMTLGVPVGGMGQTYGLGAQGSGLIFQVTPADVLTLYGLLDITFSNITNANADGKSLTAYQVSWFSGNRWGITGKHALGPDRPNVIYKLESEFVLNTGEMDTPGVIFNRDAWIGFESESLGKLTFGRQNALARDYSGIYGDPYGSAVVTLEEGGYTNQNNFKQLIYYAASATGTRYDNGIVWKKKWGENWVTGLGGQFGTTPGEFSHNTTETVAVGYNAGVFNLAGYYNHINVNGLTHQAFSIGGNVQPNSLLRVNAGWYYYKADQGFVGTRRDDAYTISAKLTPDASSLDYELGYQLFHAKNAGFNAGGFTFIPYQDASGATTSGTGDKKTAYGSIFYHFDRRTEAYLAADYMRLTDGYKLAVTNGHNSQAEVAIGMRFRF
jgi:predicted porin